MKEKIISLYGMGVPIKEICTMADVSRSYVNKVLRSHQPYLIDVKIKKNQSGIIDRKIISLHNEGKEMQEISKQLNMTPDSIYRRMIRLGLLNLSKKEEIKHLREKGLSQIEICQTLGICTSYVRDTLYSLNMGFGKTKVFEARNKEIITSYQDGVKVSDIAKKHGVSDISIYKIIQNSKNGCRRSFIRRKPIWY